MRIKVLGKFWNFRFVPNLSGPKEQSEDSEITFGKCDSPTAKNKTIKVVMGLDEEQELDTTIHELLHAAGWHITEEFVEEFASDVARVLIKLGWTKSVK